MVLRLEKYNFRLAKEPKGLAASWCLGREEKTYCRHSEPVSLSRYLHRVRKRGENVHEFQIFGIKLRAFIMLVYGALTPEASFKD